MLDFPSSLFVPVPMNFVPVSFSKKQADFSISRNKMNNGYMTVSNIEMDFSTSLSLFDMDFTTSDIDFFFPSLDE